VPAGGGAGRGEEWPVLVSVGEVPAVEGVVADLRVVRDHVDGVGADGDGGGELRLLPAEGRLPRERHGGEALAVVAPEVAVMAAAVGSGLVEPDGVDRPAAGGAEPHAQLDRVGVAGREVAGNGLLSPEAAGAGVGLGGGEQGGDQYGREQDERRGSGCGGLHVIFRGCGGTT